MAIRDGRDCRRSGCPPERLAPRTGDVIPSDFAGSRIAMRYTETYLQIHHTTPTSRSAIAADRGIDEELTVRSVVAFSVKLIRSDPTAMNCAVGSSRCPRRLIWYSPPNAAAALC